MKKLICAILIMVLLLSFFIVHGDKDDIKEDERIKIQAEIGFDKAYKPFFTTPIFITMENNLKDIDGEVQVEIPYDEGYGEAVTIYAIGINQPKDTQKKYVINLPISSHLLNIKLKVVEGKNTLLEKYVRLERGITENTALVGVLSDDTDSLRYLNGFNFDNISNTINSKIVKLNEENFPNTIDVAESFDMIIINNYDTSKLTKEQYDVLKKWTELGGFLVLGTGANGNKTLSAFTDDFITGEKESVVRVSANPLGILVNDDFDTIIDAMKLKTDDSVPIVESEGITLIQKLDKHQGSILLLSFDMGMEPIISWNLNKYFMESLFRKTAPAMLTGSNFDVNRRAGYNYNIESALKNIPELPLPQYGTIILIFIIYIIVAAPISYLVLKRIDKRELMWVVVPIFSVLFASIVYLIGFGTRIKEPLLNTVSIARVNETGFYDTKSFSGVFTPNKTNIKIQGIDNLRIKPFMRGNYYGSSDSQTWDNKRIEAKFVLSPEQSLEFYNIGVWGMKTFEIASDKNLEGNIIGNINYIDSSYTGYIENNTGFDLEDCYIITANQFLKIDDFAKGEKIDISNMEKKSFTNRFELLDGIYPRFYQRDGNTKGEELIKRRLANQKRNIIDYYYDYLGQNPQGIKLIAWSRNPLIDDIYVNNKVLKRYDNTMFIVDFDLNLVTGNNIELPFGYVEPVIEEGSLNQGHYNSYDNRFYGIGTVDISFNIDFSIKPENINIRFEKPLSNVKQYIWDNESSDWDEKELSSYNIESGELEKYLDGNNVLKFRFDLKDEGKGDGIQLPQISVKGIVK